MSLSVQRLLASVTLLAMIAGCGPAPAVTMPTVAPATAPVITPSTIPTAQPTAAPTAPPTRVPPATLVPTAIPTVAPSPVPTARASASPPARLIIDAIDLDRALVPVGLDANRVPVVLDHDVGWYKLGAMPGQGENIVLWAHVLRFRKAPHIPAPFARLKELRPGATVVLLDERGMTHRYVVTRQVWAAPDEVEYMLPQGREQVTMISCIGDKVIADGSVEMTHRLITIAEPELSISSVER